MCVSNLLSAVWELVCGQQQVLPREAEVVAYVMNNVDSN